jgi:hypothetical protein
MSSPVRVNGFEITKRFDGSYAVYDFGWWPDEDLDNNPELLASYLESTGGWRAKGWILVNVLPSYRLAHEWACGFGKASA